ncbi:transmembrane protein 223 isoform X2 [Eurytemora carolleeae]|uniref:transmembrane protein 223 isoform X1 n=1 Tax=Eurytemora carolleeae TaxID=1294199 RepID=UPI000C77C66E|nr:transmembrane protein 223 isoform X1 [Eurytemora carolleeae]XP_023345000.1 transmembrane protein 223 isoform X2 [Eurytemora carolleeae]|eukprot:XP_023344998.1 transmembrane protein 223-like isoform X1 [Eurytemora affinis]
MLWNCVTKPLFGLTLKQSVRRYFKPKQKEAFFDVEGVVNKDITLFRYEDLKKVRLKNMLGMSMLPLWAYLGYFAFTLRSKLEPFREEVNNNVRYNFLLDNVTKASVGVGAGFFLFGAGLTSYWMLRTMNTVRKLVLRKGGKYVGIQTYGLLGKNDGFMNVPVVHCSGIQHKFYGKHRFFLKVRDHSFKYSFNLEDGIFSNRPLFDRTVGISRTI